MVGIIIEKYLFADLALDPGLYKLVSGDIKVLTSYTEILTDIYNRDWNLSHVPGKLFPMTKIFL